MKNKYLLILAAASVIFTSCKKDDDSPQNPGTGNNQGEIITTVILQFTDSAGVAPDAEFTFRDPDGSGGNGYVEFDTIRLVSNTTYLAEILLLDETKSPADTISVEVLEEAEDHIFFFLHTGVNVTTGYLDSDANGLPVGIQTKWRTGTASSGTSQVILKHQPGTKDGTMGPGETDVDVTFQSEVL
jgi:hypothetical protein